LRKFVGSALIVGLVAFIVASTKWTYDQLLLLEVQVPDLPEPLSFVNKNTGISGAAQVFVVVGLLGIVGVLIFLLVARIKNR